MATGQPTFDDVAYDNYKTAQSIKADQVFEAKMEKDLAGHRQAPSGRNVFSFRMRDLDNLGYRERYDKTFPGAPGAEQALDTEFCEGCDRRRTMCRCGEDNPDNQPIVGYHSGGSLG